MNMIFKTPTDFRRSLEARLKSHAIKTHQDLQRVRRKVAFERLLARIFHSELSGFVLKGGYAMELRVASSRATKDIDLTCLRRVEGDSFPIEDIITQELRELAREDLGDYFSFEIGYPQKDLDNAPYGGARYSVSSFLDAKLFVRFQLDVGADTIVDEIEELEGSDWLGHYGIKNPQIRMISIEQQFAEKLHAYSLPRKQRLNTRTKDLVDMLLLLHIREINKEVLKETTMRVFKVRATHPFPEYLQPPPSDWGPVYEALALECGINMSMHEAYEELRKVFMQF